ncbi:hypothetical protein ACFQ1I_08370 [Kitasatospora arboriphila]
MDANAHNVGDAGTGINTQGSAADWNSTEPVVGHFFGGGSGFNDILAYNPNTQSAQILKGNGDGSALKPYSGGTVSLPSTVFTDADSGTTTTHVASGAGSSGSPTATPPTTVPAPTCSSPTVAT